jgi:hypothetical protein
MQGWRWNACIDGVGWHPAIAGVLAGIPGLLLAGVFAVGIVMHCAHCSELTPVDLSRCKNCDASISA